MMKNMKNICFVVQRYGEDISGGAEALCKQYAERLLPFYDVTVVTSCAKDYFTWKNEFKPGQETINGVNVIRFETEFERNMDEFGSASHDFYIKEYKSLTDCIKWLKANGPVCPDMIRYIMENSDAFDIFIFMGYLYYTTTMCLPMVCYKSILISTAHDETPIHECDYFAAQFLLPRGFIYLTDEEKIFVNNKFKNDSIISTVTGSGVELPADFEQDADFIKKLEELGDYIIYVGRIDTEKGCMELFEYFTEYKKKANSSLKLLLIGRSTMPIPKSNDIIEFGFVSESEKFAAIAKSKALILPSRHESLGIVVLEAMQLGIPVMLNANCSVLKAQALKSNAGLYFYYKEDFMEALDFILNNEPIARKMGLNGKKYIQENYQWDVIIKKLDNIIKKVCEAIG